MLDGIRIVKNADIQLREPLNALEREWLIGSLTSTRGVLDADYSREDSQRLSIEYDADLVNLSDLFDFLLVCGVHPAPAAPLTGRLRSAHRIPPSHSGQPAKAA